MVCGMGGLSSHSVKMNKSPPLLHDIDITHGIDDVLLIHVPLRVTDFVVQQAVTSLTPHGTGYCKMQSAELRPNDYELLPPFIADRKKSV